MQQTRTGRRVRLNETAYDHAKALVAEGKAVIDERDDWSEHQPSAREENEYIQEHGWRAYARWYLGINEEADEETKERYEFPYGDFEKVHRSGLIACVYRAAEWRHKEVERAAYRLLQHLDDKAG